MDLDLVNTSQSETPPTIKSEGSPWRFWFLLLLYWWYKRGTMYREGTCNRCGQCCGAEGSPNQDSPWPNSWPDSLRTWNPSLLAAQAPIFVLVGNPSEGASRSGAAIIAGFRVRWIWVEGHGLCKNVPPYGNLAIYSEECPCLKPDPGDGTRPCALVGTPFEPIWTQMCQSAPPLEKTPEKVVLWQSWHPLCSYTWV